MLRWFLGTSSSEEWQGVRNRQVACSPAVFRDGELLYGGLEVVERHLQSRFETDFWLPPKQCACLRDIGAALLGIVLGKRFVLDFALRSRDLNNALGALENGELHRVTDVGG